MSAAWPARSCRWLSTCSISPTWASLVSCRSCELAAMLQAGGALLRGINGSELGATVRSRRRRPEPLDRPGPSLPVSSMDVEERHCSWLFLVRREPFDDLRTISAGGCSASAFDVSSFLGWRATSGDASKGREETEDSWTERRFDREVCFEGASLGVARGLLGSLVDVTREENLGLKVEEEEGEEEARSGLEEAEKVL